MDNEELLGKISNLSVNYTIHIDGKIFALENVSLIKSAIPVRKPTTRGGAYFTDKTAYKMKATIQDMSILELLPNLMLGPSTEFRLLEVKTSLEINGTKKDITLLAHIVNTVNTNDTVELNLIVDKTSLE